MTSGRIPGAWESRHIAAFTSPRRDEADLVHLCKITNSLINRGIGQDQVLRDAVAHLLEGARILLNAEWGPRLDMGSTDQLLIDMAQRIHYDMNLGKFE